VQKVMVVEVVVGVSVKAGEDPIEVQTRVTTAALAMKKELGGPEIFTVRMNEVPAQEQATPVAPQQ